MLYGVRYLSLLLAPDVDEANNVALHFTMLVERSMPSKSIHCPCRSNGQSRSEGFEAHVGPPNFGVLAKLSSSNLGLTKYPAISLWFLPPIAMTERRMYTQLPQTEGETEDVERKHTILATKTRLILVCTSTILALALFASLAVNIKLAASETRPTLSCGTSIAEARSHGCTFDYLAKAWLSPQCPRVGTQDFLALGGGNLTQAWTYWQERDGGVELSDISELADMPDARWWTTEKEHLTHCAYLL